MHYSATALGEVVRDLRQAQVPRMNQEELGRRAGYRAGAGVSMSRIENGLTRPGPRRLAGIAAALGVTVREIEVRSVERTAPPAGDGADGATAATAGAESTTHRMRRVQGVFARRESRAVALGRAFNDAHDRARDDFLLALVVAARDVTARPPTVDGTPSGPDGASGPAADAVLRHRVAVAGLAATLASGAAAQAVDTAPDPETAYASLVATAVIAPSVAARAEADPHGQAATRATRALLGAGGSLTGRTGLAAAVGLLGGFVASAGSPLIAAGALAWVARRSRQQNEQLRLELDRAESNLSATGPAFDAVMDLLAGATELLTYVGLHAGHALARWRDTLPAGPVRWSALTGDQQRAYLAFVDVAAHQVCVDSINVTELLAAPAAEQAGLVGAADAVLALAGREIRRLV